MFVADHFQYSPACEPVVASFAELLTRHIVAERKCFALAAVQCSPHFVRKLLLLWMLGLEEVVLEVSCIEWIGIILPENVLHGFGQNFSCRHADSRSCSKSGETEMHL